MRPDASPASRSTTPASAAIDTGTNANAIPTRSEEHTSELQSPYDLVCRLLLEKKKFSGAVLLRLIISLNAVVCSFLWLLRVRVRRPAMLNYMELLAAVLMALIVLLRGERCTT